VQIEQQVRGEAYRLGQGQHKIKCPSCSHSRKNKTDRTLSLRIEQDRILYQCWHCQQQGIVPLRDEMPEPRVAPMSVAKNVVKDPLSSEAVAWLQSRGISQKTAEKAGVTSTRHWIQALGKETECIQFPYKNKGQEYAYKIRSIEDKGFSCNGSPQTFFNIELAERNDWLIICEGEMDVLAFMEGGYNSVVSVPNGAVMKVVDGHIDPKDDNKFKFLWEAKKQIDAAAKIVIATDSDAPGQAMAEEIARRIGKDRCWKIEYPEGCKDANDVLMSAGADGVDNIVVNSKPWPVAGLYDAEHFYEELDDIYDRGMGRGESTGYNNVDELYSVVTGQLTVVTGHPSSGKSEFIDQIMVNLAQSKGWKFAICSFENEPRIHIAKLISKHLRKPFFDGPSPRMTKEELGRGKEFVQSHFSFLYQADGSLSSVDSIIERLKVAVLRHGVRGAIIDPYNYIQKGRDVSETDWVSDVLTKLRVFAQAHGIHLWFVAHPTKMMRDQTGKVPAPKGYDISGSAAWFAKADVGLTVHRPDPANSIASEIHIWKCRFSWVGKQGHTELDFDVPTSTYKIHVPDPFLDTSTPVAAPRGYKDDDDFPF
jgi:twinkle protein